MKSKLLNTNANRRAIADLIEEQAAAIWETPVTLKACDLHPGEFSLRIEDVETDRGCVSWVSIDVSDRGVSIHTKFSESHLSPGGIGHGHKSRKWNHYIWPLHDETPESFRLRIAETVRLILREVKPNGLTRQSLPDLSEYWAQQRAEFAATLERRKEGVAA